MRAPSARRASPSARLADAATDQGRLAPGLAAGIGLRAARRMVRQSPPAALQAMDAGAFRAARIPICPLGGRGDRQRAAGAGTGGIATSTSNAFPGQLMWTGLTRIYPWKWYIKTRRISTLTPSVRPSLVVWGF
jgi:hypothetical protein